MRSSGCAVQNNGITLSVTELLKPKALSKGSEEESSKYGFLEISERQYLETCGVVVVYPKLCMQQNQSDQSRLKSVCNPINFRS